ncbi:hypothetical protein QFI91_20280 [Raoultella sp. WB_B2P2-3]|uniref:Uncharacterized protein n=1 Tax=Raoultella scottii TaxID=3040937 RepID=A0ABU8Z3Q3_9ENTR|nr:MULTISPECIES: hypothetical protein [Enterobacteriaceae]
MGKHTLWIIGLAGYFVMRLSAATDNTGIKNILSEAEGLNREE